jgi:hypothetical protein
MKKLFVLIVITKYNILFGQNINIFGFTPAFSQTTPISKKTDWGLFLGTTYIPTDHNFAGLNYPSSDIRFQFGNSLIYKPTKALVLTLGLLYQRNFPFDDRHINEYRPYQQIGYSHFLSKVKVSHRLRFSERFIQNTSTANYPLTTMLQYLTSVQIPLKGETLDEKEFYLTGYTEEYFTLGGEKKYKTFSEFWAYGGLGYNFGKYGKLQAGFIYECVIRNQNSDTRDLSYFELFWITNFDLFHKK